ncbi:hypothetical protein [Kocuria sp. SM24M-10]|uniref:hypothetical protein n=1 Tax=Kocuria sp. SM24M-10 TaxID=1660349 RepID=UPI001364A33A|nr:hypothetical protein [Kocuria sp. SM24M-10]
MLEPGCGTGAMVTRAPKGLDTDFHGIEHDTTSAASDAELDALHPDYDEIPWDTLWGLVEKHHRHGEGAGA